MLKTLNHNKTQLNNQSIGLISRLIACIVRHSEKVD